MFLSNNQHLFSSLTTKGEGQKRSAIIIPHPTLSHGFMMSEIRFLKYVVETSRTQKEAHLHDKRNRKVTTASTLLIEVNNHNITIIIQIKDNS